VAESPETAPSPREGPFSGLGLAWRRVRAAEAAASSIEGQFYVTGGTLPPGSPSYVARAADVELLEGLRRGEFCYVLARSFKL
jgi:hypothetical protein